MPDLFVYGTLCHRPVLAEILGRDAQAVPAMLPDLSVYYAKTKGVPEAALCIAPGTAAEGLLLQGLSDEEMARLAFFSGGFGEGLQEREALTGTGARLPVLVACSACPPQECGPLFHLSEWAADWGELARRTAREIMRQYGRASSAEIAGRRPFLAARAWAQILARGGAPNELRSGRGRDIVEIVQDHAGFEGFFRTRAFELRHQRFDGSMTETFSRECFVAYDAALVLPYDPATDRVMLIEQLRYGPLFRGDPQLTVLEPAAGLVDAGESPEACALREAQEEAGLDIRELRPMMKVYAAPGYSTEFYHCFLGLCALSEADNGIGGLEEEHEDIRNHVIPFDEALALCDSGEVNVGPLAMMLYWLARHREELRSSA